MRAVEDKGRPRLPWRDVERCGDGLYEKLLFLESDSSSAGRGVHEENDVCCDVMNLGLRNYCESTGISHIHLTETSK